MNSGLDEFRAVISDARSLHAWAIGGSTAAPLADFVLNIGAPFPPGIGLISCLLELIVYIAIFHYWFRNNQKQLGKKMAIALAVLCLSFFSYLYLFDTYTYVSPLSSKRFASGFTVRPDIQELIPEHFRTPEDALKGSEYRAEEVWTRPSITAARLLLLLSWVVLFASLSAFIGTFVMAQRRKKMRSGNRAGCVPDLLPTNPIEKGESS